MCLCLFWTHVFNSTDDTVEQASASGAAAEGEGASGAAEEGASGAAEEGASGAAEEDAASGPAVEGDASGAGKRWMFCVFFVFCIGLIFFLIFRWSS